MAGPHLAIETDPKTKQVLRDTVHDVTIVDREQKQVEQLRRFLTRQPDLAARSDGALDAAIDAATDAATDAAADAAIDAAAGA